MAISIDFQSVPSISSALGSGPLLLSTSIAIPPKTFSLNQIGGTHGFEAMATEFKDPSLFLVAYETPSVMMLLNKSTLEIVDGTQTNKFLLQSITKPQQERFQVIETFGKSHVFFYGERTRVYTLQGVLLDGLYSEETLSPFVGTTISKEVQYKHMWATALQNFYDNELRGTRLKEMGRVAALYVNGWLITGYPIQLTILKDANSMPDAVTFQMSWVIEKEILINSQTVDSSFRLTVDRTIQELQNKFNEVLAIYQKDVDERNSLPPSQNVKIAQLNEQIAADYTALQDIEQTITDEKIKSNSSNKLRKKS